MRARMGRLIGFAATLSLAASPAFAQIPAPATKIDGADTAWMIVPTGLVHGEAPQ